MQKFAKQVNNPAASKMTKEKYLNLCEAQGIEPDERHMPLELTDFPPIVMLSTTIFNALRDVYIPGEMPVYVGKDLAPLQVLLDIHEVEKKAEQQLVLKIINILDSSAVDAARKRMEAIRNKKPKVPGVRGGSRV